MWSGLHTTILQMSVVCWRQVIVTICLTNTLNLSMSQIYVEIERARLTKTLANIKEQNGEVKEAAAILQELQVRNRWFQFYTFKMTRSVQQLLFPYCCWVYGGRFYNLYDYSLKIHRLRLNKYSHSLLTHVLIRWRHMAQWRKRRRWSLYWNRWGFALLSRITFVPRSSARR